MKKAIIAVIALLATVSASQAQDLGTFCWTGTEPDPYDHQYDEQITLELHASQHGKYFSFIGKYTGSRQTPGWKRYIERPTSGSGYIGFDPYHPSQEVLVVEFHNFGNDGRWLFDLQTLQGRECGRDYVNEVNLCDASIGSLSPVPCE